VSVNTGSRITLKGLAAADTYRKTSRLSLISRIWGTVQCSCDLAVASTDYKNLAKAHMLTYTAPTLREGQ
jgi:hypothetical protein